MSISINSADWVSKQEEYRNYWLNAFWIRVRFVKYRFARYVFVRYWFRFVSRPWLDIDIPSKHFVCLQDVFKISSRYVFKTSWGHVFKTSWRPTNVLWVVLFGNEKSDYIFNKIRYLISLKSGIPEIISHNYAKIKVDSCDSLSLEKIIIFHNVVILIKSVFNKDKNSYYYKKASYELPKK